jgi:HlyD family secretion protein
MKKRIVLGIGLLLAAGLVWWWFKPTQVAARADYRTAKVDRGTVTQAVSATGRLSARVTVDVGSQVSGQIAELKVDFNSVVKTGELLARIDDSVFRARVAQSRAELAIAEANRVSADAAAEQARVNALDADRALKRALEVRQRGLISQADLDAAQLRADQARAQQRVAAASITQAQAQIVQRNASLEAAQADLDRCDIRSPVDGIVIARNVSRGQTVAASLQAPVLFTIAEDLSRMQVEASIDEADIGQVKVGQAVRFTVDAFANARFEGVVEQVRKLATLQLNVVTYTVVISALNPELKLLPGMTANLNLIVAERANALRVPNAALRFSPPNVAAPTGGGESGPRGDPSARMASELGLDAAQSARLKQILGGMRGEMASIMQSNPSPEERRARMGAIFANAAAALRPTLRTEQIPKLDQWLAERGRASGNRARVFVQGARGPEPKLIEIGLSDGSQTEVLSGLDDGQDVIVGVATPSAS